MISFEEARRTILEAVQTLDSIERPLLQCLGVGLAQPLVAQLDSPVFDNSAVDGYGVAAGSRGRIRVVGVSSAGGAQPRTINSSEAIRIFTGAPLPSGVDAVVMQEEVVRDGEWIEVEGAPKPGQHIRRRGEEYLKGTQLAPRGTEITPALIALAAANGLATLHVARRPRIAIVVTGDELVSAGADRSESQIFESNGAGIHASVLAAGGIVSSQVAVPDAPDAQSAAFSRGLAEADALIVSGGMSVGDRDHARSVLASLGMDERFWRIQMRPGKPVLFGLLGSKPVFGLPGNPVSSLVTFHLLVRPAIRKMLGISTSEPTLIAKLERGLSKAQGRAEFLRGLLSMDTSGLTVAPFEGQGSHMASGLASANCLICLPAQQEFVAEGELVAIVLLL